MTRPQRFSAPLLLIVAIALAARPAPAAEALPGLIKRTAPAVVTVVAYKADYAMPGIGTGFFVAPDRIVTARHVLAHAERAVARTSDGHSIALAGIVAEDRSADLVMVQLKAAKEGAATLEIAADAPEVGERLFTISSPLGLEFTAADGIVSAYREVPGAGVAVQHTVPVSVGSSGCPLLNDKGQVVAVQTGVLTTGSTLVSAGQQLNFAVSAKLIAKLKPGDPKPLASTAEDLPNDWKPLITSGIDTVSLHALTREDFKAATVFFRQAALDDPDDADAWFRLGLCYEKTGEKDKAVKTYRKALDLQPEFPNALNNLGAVYIAQGKYDEAADVLRKATEFKKDYGPAFGNLAVALVQKKDWPAALKAAREAVRLKADDPEAHLNLGTAAARTGNEDEAKKQYQELLKLDKPRAERLKAILDEAGRKEE